MAAANFMESLGIHDSEWEDESLDLHNTAGRIKRAFQDDFLSSYREGAREEMEKQFTTFPSDGKDAMVVSGPFSYSSLCAHHLLPFMGEAYVGYIPDKKVIGASKIPRTIDFFARMLQIQERLARQIADFIAEKAQPRWVAVLLTGDHLCMRCRGVKQENGRMVTTAIRPQPTPDDPAWRGVIDEFHQQLVFIRKA